jgi:hypothetical protein
MTGSSLPTQATATRAPTRAGEDLDHRLCPCPSSDQGSDFHLCAPPTGWTRCITNWQRFMPSPPRNWWSAPAGTAPTPLLAWFRPTPVGKGLMRHHPQQGRLHYHRLTSPAKPCCSGEAHMLRPWRADGPIRWAHNQSGVRGTRATVSPTAGGNTTVTLRGQGLRCLEATCVICH